MRLALLFLLGVGALATGSLAAGPAELRIDRLAGRYSHSFTSGLIDGSTYRAENVVEIRVVDARHAQVSLNLDFYNGHSCSIEGTAQQEGNRLVLNEPEYRWFDGKPCRLELWTDRTRLHWSDGENTCKSGCGSRGTFSSGSVPLRSKRRLPVKPLSRDQ